MDVNLPPKPQLRIVKIFWVLGLLAGVVVGAAVAVGIARTQGSASVPAQIRHAA